jgi:dTDP-4-amino-4,6-dideoxygalactose transaminase
MKIPFLELSALHAELTPELDEVWRAVSRSGQFIDGTFVERFELEWAAYCGTAYAVGLASGTAALHLGLTALGIGSGDEVIVPANTFFATVEAILAVGATPVFIDVDPSSLLMSVCELTAAITPRTAAVIVVHLYGQPANMDEIEKTARAAGLAIIEDAAQAHGATWRGRRAGSMSDIGCFSFYAGKNLGAFGDAGAVTTNDSMIAQRIRSLRNHGRSPDDPGKHDYVGGNHRLDELQAAILSVKLERLDAWNARRERIAKCYRSLLAELPIELLDVAPDARSNNHLFVIQCDRRDYLRQRLHAAGVGTGVHYPIPCHRQPALSSLKSQQLPVAEHAARRILSIPMGPHLTQSDAIRVSEAISGAFKNWKAAPETTERRRDNYGSRQPFG